MLILYLFMYFLYWGPIGAAPGSGVPLGIPGLGFPLGRSWVRGSHWGCSRSGPLGPPKASLALGAQVSGTPLGHPSGPLGPGSHRGVSGSGPLGPL